MGHLDLGGCGWRWGRVTRISYRPKLEFGVKFGDSREKDVHKKKTLAGHGERRL